MNQANDWSRPANPYAAPESIVEDGFGGQYDPWGGRMLATRGSRLGARMIDGLASLLVAAPMFVSIFGAAMNGRELTMEVFLGLGGFVTGVLLLALIAYNLMRLHSHQQTIGKQLLGIQIIRNDLRTPATLGRIIGLRIIPVQLLNGVLNFIPIIGGFLTLVDPLLIFQDSQQCLHDIIADTNVVVYED